MKALFPSLALGALMLASCSTSSPRERVRVQFEPSPTNILAADIAQNRAAQEDGVLKALRRTATDDALVLAPGPINAKQWLGAQSDFPTTSWEPHRAIMSCDGKMGVTTGAISWDGTPGFYTTVWEYQPRGRGGAEGDWEWILSHGDGVASPLPEPDIIRTEVASCDNTPMTAPFGDSVRSSEDGTLVVGWDVPASGGRTVSVKIWDGEAFKIVLEDVVPAR